MRMFLQMLNTEPDPSEFEKTPDKKADYLPISFVEMTLDELFLGLWSTENFTWSVLGNEVQGSLELVCIHPVSGHEIRRSGAGSIVITVDALDEATKKAMTSQDRNKHALNPDNKKPNALDLAFPKLKAECVKNAAQTLGKRFGRDINRKKKDVLKPVKVPISKAAFSAAKKRVENGEALELLLGKMALHFEISEAQREELEAISRNGARPETPVLKLETSHQ